MKNYFISAQFTPFNYSFKRPLPFKKLKIKEKRGVFLTLTDQKNRIGIGELSPFKGLSKKKLPQLQSQLEKVLPELIETEFDLKNIDITKPFFNLFPTIEQLDSHVIFCIEGALLSWLEKSHPTFFQTLFNFKDLNFSLPYNGLYLPEDSSLEDVVEQWTGERLSTIKIKIGNIPLKNSLDLIWNISRLSKEKFKLRLDANKSFTLEEFNFFIKNLPHKNIEYIEDPLKDLSLIKDHPLDSKISLALDEDLLLYKDHNLPSVKAWILKPSIIGGYSKTFEFIEQSHRKSILAVVSSCFESNLSLRYLAITARYQNLYQKTPCGLNTFNYLENDNSMNKPQVSFGNLYFDQVENM
jgi:O-succinylbenzoate synthase